MESAVLTPKSSFRRFTGLVLMCLSIPIAVYGAEIVFAHLDSGYGSGITPAGGLDTATPDHKQEIETIARRSGIEVDLRDRWDILAELRDRHVDAVNGVMLGGLVRGDAIFRSAGDESEFLPLGGISRAHTVLCNETGEFVVYESDEHGFRNPAGTWSAASTDVAVVGESFVQGYCVPDGESFVDRIRTQFPATLNLGVSGGAPLLQLAAIKEYASHYQSKITLWVYCEGIDLVDVPDEMAHSWLKRYLEASFGQRLIDRQPEIDAALRAYGSAEEIRIRQRATDRDTGGRSGDWRGWVEARLKLWDLRERLAVKYGVGTGQVSTGEPPDSTLQVLSESLSRARDLTSSWGGQLYFVYLPSWGRFKNGSRLPDRERARVLAVAKANGVPTIDVVPAFDRIGDPLALFPFRRFLHYNEKGNRVVAEAILGALPNGPEKYLKGQ
jgi:hypothetical protein